MGTYAYSTIVNKATRYLAIRRYLAKRSLSQGVFELIDRAQLGSHIDKISRTKIPKLIHPKESNGSRTTHFFKVTCSVTKNAHIQYLAIRSLQCEQVKLNMYLTTRFSTWTNARIAVTFCRTFIVLDNHHRCHAQVYLEQAAQNHLVSPCSIGYLSSTYVVKFSTQGIRSRRQSQRI